MHRHNLKRKTGKISETVGNISTIAELDDYIDAVVSDARPDLDRGELNSVLKKMVDFIEINFNKQRSNRQTIVVFADGVAVTAGFSQVMGAVPYHNRLWNLYEVHSRVISGLVTDTIDVTVTFSGSGHSITHTAKGATAVSTFPVGDVVSNGDLITVETANLVNNPIGLIVTLVFRDET